MTAKNLDHLNMTVSNLADSLAWYGRVFDFAVVETGDYRGAPWAIIRSGEAMLCLYERSACETATGEDLLQRGLHGLSHFGIRVLDARAWQATVEREKLEVLYGGAVAWPHSTSWYVKDPTGYEIEVVCWDDDRVAFG